MITGCRSWALSIQTTYWWSAHGWFTTRCIWTYKFNEGKVEMERLSHPKEYRLKSHMPINNCQCPNAATWYNRRLEVTTNVQFGARIVDNRPVDSLPPARKRNDRCYIGNVHSWMYCGHGRIVASSWLKNTYNVSRVRVRGIRWWTNELTMSLGRAVGGIDGVIKRCPILGVCPNAVDPLIFRYWSIVLPHG